MVGDRSVGDRLCGYSAPTKPSDDIVDQLRQEGRYHYVKLLNEAADTIVALRDHVMLLTQQNLAQHEHIRDLEERLESALWDGTEHDRV